MRPLSVNQSVVLCPVFESTVNSRLPALAFRLERIKNVSVNARRYRPAEIRHALSKPCINSPNLFTERMTVWTLTRAE
jgi:hypothetical protein